MMIVETPSALRLNTQSRCLRQLFTADLSNRSRPLKLTGLIIDVSRTTFQDANVKLPFKIALVLRSATWF